MHSPWNHLESIPGLTALPSIWRASLGDAFDTFKILCLQPGSTPATSIPCRFYPTCAHRVIIIPDFPPSTNPQPSTPNPQPLLLGICQSHPPNCANLKLTPADLIPL